MTTEVTVTREELAALVKEAVQAAFRDVGLYTEDVEKVEETRADFRFVRRMRLAVDGVASKIGMAVVLAIVTGVLGLVGLGARTALK